MPVSSLRLLPVVVAAGLFAAPALAQVQGVGYRLAPLGGHVWFDDDAGLTNGFNAGGGLGISFGEYLELGGLYLRSFDLRTDFSRFSGLEDAPELAGALRDLPARDVLVERYGGELQLRLSSTGLAPFVTGGAGIVRFDPEGRDATENIYLTAGAGIQLTGADRFALSVQGGLLTYRYNPGTTFFTAEDLATVGLTPAQFNEVVVNNLFGQASLRLYLGGRRPGELSEIDRAFLRQTAGGLSGLSFQVEPYFTRVSFNEALPFADQSFAGVEAGPDFGPLVGLRGFYARGIAADDPFDVQPIQLYGGLLRLRLAEGTGVIPFLSVGAGYLDVLDGYQADPDAVLPLPPPEDRFFAVGGAGVELPFGPRLRLHGEFRAVAMSNADPEDISSPDQVFISPSFRVGATFGLGGRTGRAPEVIRLTEAERRLEEERRRRERALAERDERLEARREEAERLEARIAELERELEAARERGDLAEADRVAAARREAERELLRRREAERAAAPRATGFLSDRTVTIPIPTEGEIYIRYGPPGAPEEVIVQGAPAAAVGLQPPVAAAPTDEQIRQAVREALREATPAPATAQQQRIEQALEELLRREIAREGAQLSAAEQQLLERRLLDRFNNELAAIRAELRRAQQTGQQPPIVIQQPPTVVAAPGTDPRVVTAPARQQRFGAGFAGVMPLAGFALDRPAQLLVGLRADYQTGFSPTSPRYYPELLLGFGGRRSITFNMNAIQPLGNVGGGFLPYVGVGGGLATFAGREEVEVDPIFGDVTRRTERRSFRLGLNLVAGTEYQVGPGLAFGELSSVNFTRGFRLLGGYRISF